jgi:hypothetical protein
MTVKLLLSLLAPNTLPIEFYLLFMCTTYYQNYSIACNFNDNAIPIHKPKLCHAFSPMSSDPLFQSTLNVILSWPVLEITPTLNTHLIQYALPYLWLAWNNYSLNVSAFFCIVNCIYLMLYAVITWIGLAVQIYLHSNSTWYNFFI